jgi:predicted AAA+ superfamily ATPase
MIPRWIGPEIRAQFQHRRTRFLVLSGARQVGKTTLARSIFSDLPLLNLDSPFEREQLLRLGPEDWIQRYPKAVLDEVQKAPALLETLKAASERAPQVRYVLLGSSQILLLRGVRETLAGRSVLRELFPFTLPERLGLVAGEVPSLLIAMLKARESLRPLHETHAGWALGPRAAAGRDAWQKSLVHGDMPALLDPTWSDQDRVDWLQDYQLTYLQRDLGDLARLDSLEPFVRAQRVLALRTAQTVQLAEVARAAGIAAPTARRYLRYLDLSYQTFLLEPWFRNLEKRLAKMPKLHWFDSGVRRAVVRKRGDTDGPEFETAVVAEIRKQCKAERLAVDFHHLRTADGREVDLLIEREDGFFAVECKLADRVSPSDARHLRGLEQLLDKPVLARLLVCGVSSPRRLEKDPELWAVPAPYLLT